MNLDMTFGLVGLALGLIPYLGLVGRWLTRRRPARRFLGLHKDHAIHVIVSTNAMREAAPGEARAYTTAIGELRAVAVGARRVLPLYKDKKVSAYMSEDYAGRLQADVLLVGGPFRNRYSKSFLRLVNQKHPAAQLVLDAQSSLIGLGGSQFVFDQHLDDGVPTEDLALLVIASDVWSTEAHQRVILCAGLSTYGTEGAARFLFERVLAASRSSARLRRLLSGSAAAALVHVDVEQGRAVNAELYKDMYWSVKGQNVDAAVQAVTIDAQDIDAPEQPV
jgi:hypothetical protein